MPPSHSVLGNFNFGQVGTQEVYFGEWWKAGDTPASASHTVYYAGDNTNTTVQPRVLQPIPLQELTALQAIC